MSSHEYIQKKNSQQSTPPTTTNTFTSRPFAPEVENAAPQQPISVEQIQAAQQFGYKAVSLKTFVPSSIVEASPKEEAEIEIESPKLHSNTPSETPPEISPQVPIIQRQPDEEKASAREEKIAEKPRENI